ncbi:FAD:protein FMN transferase [Demequina sp.]|uniref:FAD:protein FMN transferase n=1 Tax=Demequina sp. TaxID=2050685 RepID=UPI003A87D8F4
MTRAQTVRRSVTAMAMDFTLDVHGGVREDTLDAVMAQVAKDLEWVDSTFSTWRDDSWISRLRRGQATVADAPALVVEVLDLCERFRDETDGAFDARGPDGLLDPTGIVKTWAMERVRWRLGLLGAGGWLWGCGGDATASGRGPAEGGWRIGIADPREEPGPQAATMRRIVLGRGMSAIATSGHAHRQGHVWDPFSRAPAQYFSQVSVAGDDLVKCDAWATAVLAGGKRTLRKAEADGLAVLAMRVVDGSVRASATAAWSVIG